MLLNCGVGKTLESPLDCKEINLVHPKRNQSWIVIGRTDAEAETPTLWPPDAKNWLLRKDPDAGKDWRQEKGTTEDEIVGWHHRLNEHKFEQTPGDSEETGKPGMLQSMGWQRVRHNWTTELNWILITETKIHSTLGHHIREKRNRHTENSLLLQPKAGFQATVSMLLLLLVSSTLYINIAAITRATVCLSSTSNPQGKWSTPVLFIWLELHMDKYP